MRLPSHFVIPWLVISTWLLGSQGCAQLRSGVQPGRDSWQTGEEASQATEKKLMAVPAFGDYLAKCTGAIVLKPVKWDGSPVGTFIVARFKLREDGIVSAIELSGSTNTPAAAGITKNIKSCSPFPRWPDGMRFAVDKPYLEIYVHYGYCHPPGN